ncbi:MAG: glycosyltransferase [Desulfobacterales bacterium]|nr:glycosyltransferase [Desulfobacterales bacterium]
MKIALVGLTHPFRGGISHYTTLLCRTLQEKHEVEFYTLKKQYPVFLFPGTTQMDSSKESLTVDNIPCLEPMNPLSWIAAHKKIRAQAPDFILFSWWHPFFAPCFGTLARLAKFAKIPSCFLCHNVLPHEQSLLDRLLLRYALRAAPVFITHSARDRDSLLTIIPRARVLVNPHPGYTAFSGDHAPSRAEARAALGLSGRKVLLFFGLIRKYKGLRFLLDAMTELPAEEGYHLLIVGEFYEDRAEYRQAVELLQDRGQLTLVDRYVANEEIGNYFRAADILAAPYATASQSGVIQMAYGFQVPVLASRVGGISEAVADGVTGLLVEPGNPHEIAAAAKRFFSDTDTPFHENISRENEKNSWQHLVNTIEEIGTILTSRAGPNFGP